MITLQNYPTQLILLLFILIVFLQSGLDKIINYKENLGWLKSHFSKTPLKKMVPTLLFAITVVEIMTGLLAVIGVYYLTINDNPIFAWWAALLACITLLMLLFGQRIAKDYLGASTLVTYLIACSFLLYILT